MLKLLIVFGVLVSVFAFGFSLMLDGVVADKGFSKVDSTMDWQGSPVAFESEKVVKQKNSFELQQEKKIVVETVIWCGREYTSKEWAKIKGSELYWQGKCPGRVE